jgi:hypothetical protein
MIDAGQVWNRGDVLGNSMLVAPRSQRISISGRSLRKVEKAVATQWLAARGRKRAEPVMKIAPSRAGKRSLDSRCGVDSGPTVIATPPKGLAAAYHVVFGLVLRVTFENNHFNSRGW